MAAKHVVRPGESPSGIAAKYGAESWAVIYQHAANAELREKRKDEHAVFPGDVVNIPKIEPKTFTLVTSKRHKLVVPRPKARLNVVVKDAEGQPLASKAFRLSGLGLDEPIKGTTTGDGRVDCKVPVDLQQAQLAVWAGDKDGIRYVWNLDVSGLFGPETRQGVRQRLCNLGYHAGQADDNAAVPSDSLALAIAAFQEDMGLDVTGKMDNPTLAKLVDEHGGT
jgi:hypothetical protein